MTETEKWKDPWFSNLTNDERIAWLYLLDDCDNAGVWQFNIRALNFNCNTNFTEEELLSIFSERFVKISSDRFLIPKFLYHQYGVNFLDNKKSRPILSAIEKLKKYNLVEENDNGKLTLTIPLTNPYLTTKDQEQDKAKDQEKAKDKDKDMVKDHILNVQVQRENWENELLTKLNQ